ncbi:anthranilate synthase component II [Blastochloris sulfoviridis]|uniref:Aminodeoxychorismate/anthranilate synthase component II n=1 Tax=Blastochloris sulfoviridis TaxID=50712 RepID=A0A5M6HUT4_9HYPH|nr:aminodeoxychorismate/anthranilate synthase component II [Blastochloris sulfoviridis]KAA5599525.1 aminodeoxychorismate/anthranilate synthase component II [Blastochloris sulfoviridis]
MILLIDNYDSFTWNLVQYLGDLGAELNVIRNDEITVEAAMDADPDAIVLSPGPCTPNEAGICCDLIARASASVPMLGVCLGHQAMGQVFGGKVIRAPAPMHGKISEIRHAGAGVFRGINGPFQGARYHSLIVERDSLPADLAVTAETADGLIMGLAHRQLPVHGVQFHPESIASEHGHVLLKNFLDLAADWNARSGRRPVRQKGH